MNKDFCKFTITKLLEYIILFFQACSNLEDVETCIAILDQNEWNLMVMLHL